MGVLACTVSHRAIHASIALKTLAMWAFQHHSHTSIKSFSLLSLLFLFSVVFFPFAFYLATRLCLSIQDGFFRPPLFLLLLRCTLFKYVLHIDYTRYDRSSSHTERVCGVLLLNVSTFLSAHMFEHLTVYLNPTHSFVLSFFRRLVYFSRSKHSSLHENIHRKLQ